MKAYILLGGLGTRMRPLTNLIPKPLLPLAGKPFLWYQLKLLENHNVKEVALGLGYRSQKFQDALARLKPSEMNVEVVIEDKPLGTGGAVALASPLLTETTFIFNGDVLTDLNLSAMADFHRKNHATVTVATVCVPDPQRYGLLVTSDDNRVQEFREKPKDLIKKAWINAGIYLFEPKIIAQIPRGKDYSLERDFFPLLIKNKEPFFAYRHTGYWLDIGTIFTYQQAKQDISSGRFAFLNDKDYNV
ncbi:MAG: NDP-sugar synthase [Candidatus Omnitrophota bacterium]|nr:NDP-sugar synthase [Candidatus Omnitrophota bacterium]